MKFFIIATVFLLSATVEARTTKPAFKTTEFEISSQLTLINKENNKEYPLLGIKDITSSLDALKDFNDSMVGKELFCTVYDKGTWCNFSTSNEILGKVIIDNGIAREDCEATHGQFGTCNLK